MITNQIAFDTALNHLRKQGAYAAPINGKDGCAYRGPNGTSCAVGCMIPDALYTDAIEGTWASDLMMGYPDIRDHFKGVSLALLTDLQQAHDIHLKLEGVAAWEARMSEIAEEHGLTYATPEVVA